MGCQSHWSASSERRSTYSAIFELDGDPADALRAMNAAPESGEMHMMDAIDAIDPVLTDGVSRGCSGVEMGDLLVLCGAGDWPRPVAHRIGVLRWTCEAYLK